VTAELRQLSPRLPLGKGNRSKPVDGKPLSEARSGWNLRAALHPTVGNQ
jgi:hypothetical protein